MTCNHLLHKDLWQNTLQAPSTRKRWLFWHSLPPAWQHEQTQTSHSAAVNSSSFQTSHATWDEGSATLLDDGFASVSWSVLEWRGGCRCGRLLISLWTSVVSIRSTVNHERGEVRAEWFLWCIHVIKQADDDSKRNRFTKSSPCYFTRPT